MNHLSAKWWARAAAAADLFSEEEVRTVLRERFNAAGSDKQRFSRGLGVTPFRLTLMLRGRGRITAPIAKRLGYRKVIRYERVE